jgi:hypothetical protein
MVQPPGAATIAVCQCGSFLIPVGGLGNTGDGYFRGKRFLCTSCGALYASTPRVQTSTREGEARLAALETEFLVNCGSKLFCFGVYRKDCPKCNGPDEQEHLWHASQRDWSELTDAIKWLNDKTGREFGMVNGELGHYKELISEVGSAADPRSLDMLRGDS